MLTNLLSMQICPLDQTTNQTFQPQPEIDDSLKDKQVDCSVMRSEIYSGIVEHVNCDEIEVRVCNTTGVTHGVGTATRDHPQFFVGFVFLELQFSVKCLYIVICPFNLFLLNIVLSVRKTNTVEVPQMRTTYHGLYSFRFADATLWNELPNELRNVSSLSQFKSLINSWSGGSCRCGFCKS